MKKMFTKSFSTALVIVLTTIAFAVNAQTTSLTNTTATTVASTTGVNSTAKAMVNTEATATSETKTEVKAVTKAADPDTSFKPVRRLWGYAFGDFYYKSHSDPLGRGGSNQYTGVPQDRNAFQFRRIYLGYDYDITKQFSAELLLAAEDNFATVTTPAAAGATSGDLLTNNKLTFYIKLLNLRWKNIWNGTDLVIGQQSTPAFPLLSEKIWSYRSIERTVADIRRTPSYDLGAGLQGTFDPATKNYGFDLMVANGTSDKPENDIYKWFYGDVYAKFLDQKLIFDLYADYEQLTGNTATVSATSRNMIKGYVAYTTPKFTVGIEAFTNMLKNGALATRADKTTAYLDQTAVAWSFYVRGPIVKNKIGFFARYDTYNPDTNYDNAAYVSYKGLVGNYDPNIKEEFFTAGLDFTPTKNVHLMPNIWANRYKNQQANITGSAVDNADVVYRLTAYFTFGK
ncbi:MAG: hypothetical protein M3N14_11620 [Bacteroidota bacterium]|nr:hypothetical protein [Bacteroidota bacterium]